MGKTERPLPKQIADFVKFHLADKHCFAPFCGSDFSAWNAFLYGVQLYGRGDLYKAIDIMRACINAAQLKEDVLAVFKKSIPGVLDWGFERTIWNEIYPRMHAGDPHWANPVDDGERICSHIHSKPSKKHEGYFRCKDCGTEWRSADN